MGDMNKIIEGLEGVAWTLWFILFMHWIMSISGTTLFKQTFDYISGWYWVGCLLLAVFLSNYNSRNY